MNGAIEFRKQMRVMWQVGGVTALYFYGVRQYSVYKFF